MGVGINCSLEQSLFFNEALLKKQVFSKEK